MKFGYNLICKPKIYFCCFYCKVFLTRLSSILYAKIAVLLSFIRYNYKKDLQGVFMDILQRIEELRKAKNISIQELAKKCGISRNAIYLWYNKNYQPTIGTLELICEKGFGITIQEFFGITDKSNLTHEQIDLLNRWSMLTDKQKQSLLQIIDNYLE